MIVKNETESLEGATRMGRRRISAHGDRDMSYRLKMIGLMLVIAVLSLAAPAKAQLIPDVTAFASSFFTPDDRNPNNAVNGNGLVGSAHNTLAGPNVWLTALNDPAPSFTANLGAIYSIDSMQFWNYNENANPTCCLTRGLAVADVSVAGPDGVFTPVFTGLPFDIAPGIETDFSETFPLGGVQAQFVRFDNITNHGDANYTGISEVQFSGTFVSEPVSPGEIPATIHSVSSELVGNFSRPAVNMVNKSGMPFLNGHHSVVPDGSMWLSHGTFAAPNDLNPEVVFDLGSVENVDRMKIWNYNETLPGRLDLLNRGIQTMDIMVAGEDLVFSMLLQGVQLAIAPGLDNVDFGQVVDLSVDARYIKFSNMTNYGNAENFVGLSEVQFFGAEGNPIPEPAMLGLLGVGLGLLVRRGQRG